MSDDLDRAARRPLGADAFDERRAAAASGQAGAPGADQQAPPDPLIAISSSQAGDISIGDVAGGNLTNIGIALCQIVYGRDPREEEHRRLTIYLARLAARLRRLPLGALAATLDDGEGVALERVYTPLATQRLDVEGRGEPAVAQPRSLLAAEAVSRQRRLVLLADPGGGKSTFLRHLAWALAKRGLDELGTHTELAGWAAETRLLPALLPLRRLAARLARASPAPALLTAAIVEELEQEYGVREAAALLDSAFATDGARAAESALLLLDGLDEAPLAATPALADRLTVLRAVKEFATLHPQVRIVVSCRTRAFGERLRSFLDWPVEALAPLTLEQIDRFVNAWLSASAPASGRRARREQRSLMAAITGSERLRQLAASPLLLTMMTMVRSEPGELPRDRPMLYEEVLHLLMGAWDAHGGGQSLADAIGAPELRGDDLRTALDELAFAAHGGELFADGRGRLRQRELRLALTQFLEGRQVPGAWEAAGRCLAHFNDRSGLLTPVEGGASYAFAHLTLQEHCAGRHLLLQRHAVQAVMERRADDRWREPIALGLGVVQHQRPELADRIAQLLTELIDPDEAGRPKPRARWYRDLIMAAELGQERDWAQLRALFNTGRLQRDLRRDLVILLNDEEQPLPAAERVRAGFLLGELGDPRFPVTLDEWRHAVAQARAGDQTGYFRRIPIEGASRWLGRYPITNAQLREWRLIAAGPAWRREQDANFSRPNQPAAGVSWSLAAAFCDWLSPQLGSTIRLPSGAEWEAAASGPDGRLYPWGNRRQRDRAATKEDHERRGWPYTVPVGCYPAGASAAGSLDMAGNVWEWTSDVWEPATTAQAPPAADTPRELRGGGYLSKRRHTLVTARIGLAPRATFDNGFRVLLEL